ncbi:MAG: hypothetical protein FWD65_01910 [Coriobacteriia bacterium]|nr:hypothetical protein [Coriobacteriia bacterium]
MSSDLKFHPINLVLLEKEPLVENNAIVRFFGELGFSLRNGDLLLMGGFYFLCWLVVLFFNVFAGHWGSKWGIAKIPAVFTYILLAFPFALFAVALVVYGMKRFFGFLHHKLPFPVFLLLCIALWLMWTYGNFLLFKCLETAAIGNIQASVIPLVLVLAVAAFVGGQVGYWYILRWESPIPRSVLVPFSLIHGLLFLLIFVNMYVSQKQGISLANFFSSAGGKRSMLLVLGYAQLVVYSMVTFATMSISWVRRL